MDKVTILRDNTIGFAYTGGRVNLEKLSPFIVLRVRGALHCPKVQEKFWKHNPIMEKIIKLLLTSEKAKN